MARYAFRVFEIEHDGDRDDALRAIARAGVNVIEVASESGYGDADSSDDSIAVLVEFAGSRAEMIEALHREEVCL